MPNPPNPRPVRRIPEGDHPDPRMSHRDRGDTKLEDGDEDAVPALEEAVDPLGEAQVADPERERGVPLGVDEPAGEDRPEDEQEALVGEHRSPGAADLPVLLLGGSGAVRERDERDHAEHHRGGSVGDEERPEVLLREEPSDREADREREVEQQPVERVRRHAVLRGNKVGDQRTRGGTVELREERIDDHDAQHGEERAGLEEEQHQGGGGDHRDRDRVPASDAVRQQAARELREHRSDPVAGDRQAGFGHRESVLREVQREEREDEAPEPEHERAGEEDPRGARQGSVTVAEPRTSLDG